MIQCRLQWDVWSSPWTDVDDKLLEMIGDGGNVTLRLEPPVHWRFNADMIQQLGGRIAVEATLVKVEFRRKVT